jgi:uncharacterized protein (TIGR02588 family)
VRRNLVEWSVLGISLLSIALLVGALVVQGLAESEPANPRVDLHEDRALQGELGWIVPATVSNAGDEAAEAVVLEAAAEIGGATELSTVEVNFLPAGTNVEVAFSFSQRPENEIEVRLLGYRTP